MGKLVGFCGVISLLFVLSKWGVESFELDEFFISKNNSSDVSLLESMSFLESVYGVSAAAVPADALMVGLTLVQGAAAKGAVCLDGTLPGYHLHRGFGTGANSWLIQLEGGGWCNNLRSCIYRKTTHRGSSKYFEKQYPFTGILSNKAEENPDFFNWNRVKVRYCDGASFAGDSDDKASGLQFRGQRIWLAAMEDLMSKGMHNANQALLSGCSAGGLASILHCDEFRSLFPGSTKVKCLSDAGLFMDASDVSGGHTLRSFFDGVVTLQGVGKNLPSTCTDHLDPTSCFFPQNLIANIKTPLFLLNAAYDAWQVQASLAPPTADPHGDWHDCKMNNERCSASQIQFLQGFRNQMLNAVKVVAASRQNGLFINSCFAHCQSERQDTWFADDSPIIYNKGEDSEPGYNNLSPSRINGKGGFRATSFIYALVALENMGFVANMVSLVLYFSYKMYFDLSTSANTLTNLMGSTFLLSIVGGFISDTYFNRFQTCVIFGALEVLALTMMTIQAQSDSLLPKPCGGKSSCMEGGVAVYFYASLCLMALGVGGVKGSLAPLGADQFDPKDPKEAKGLASYFNWLLLSSVTGSAVGVTVIVYIATNKNNHNWWKGFLITAVGAFVGYVFLVVGKPFYRIQVPRDSPLTRIAQVIVVAIKNSGLPHPESSSELYEINEKDSESTGAKIGHTQQFRCLDKAAILPPNTAPSPWKVCTVTQVEEVKILTRMLPIIASTIILNTCMAQLQTFSVQQGYRMDPHLGSFQVPAASIPVIPLLFMIVLIPIYDRLFVPFARKITKHPSGVTQLQRVGVGLVLSALSMSVAALIEVKRKNRSLKDPMRPISLFWLAYQYGIFGIADMFTLVGLLEFFYKEAPEGMKSLSTSFTWITTSFGYFLSSVFVESINAVTRRIAPSKEGWLHGQDLDRNNLNLFYWFLAILSGLNFFNYLFWATWYKYKNNDDDGNGGVVVFEAAATPGGESIGSVPFLKAAANGGSVVEEANGKEW